MPLTLYCDEGFGPGDASTIRGLGLRAELAQRHRPGADDPLQLLFAARKRWVLLTTDEDYLALHCLWCVFRHWRPFIPFVPFAPLHHGGILRMPNTDRRTNTQLVTEAVEQLRRLQRQGEPLQDRCWAYNVGNNMWHEVEAFNAAALRVRGIRPHRRPT